jgi:hypothetical protein
LPPEAIAYLVPESKAETVQVIPLEDAEQQLREHLDGEGDRALAVTPGCGKTRAAIQRATEESKSGRVVYSVPNHRLADEIISRLPSDVSTLHFYGRDRSGPGKCHRYFEARSAINHGFTPGRTVCLSCEHNPASKKEGEPCSYKSQLKALGKGGALIFCAHGALPSLVETKHLNPAVVYVDESALEAMLNKGPEFDLNELSTLKSFMNNEQNGILSKIEYSAVLLRKELTEQGLKIGRLYSGMPTGQWRGKHDLWHFAGIGKAEALRSLGPRVKELLEHEEIVLFREGVNRAALLWLGAALGEGLAWIQVEAQNSKSTLTFKSLAIQELGTSFKMARLRVLDATLDEHELRALFGRELSTLDLNVQWEGRRVWLKQVFGKVRAEQATSPKLERYLKAMIEHIPAGVTHGALITFKNCEVAALEILQRLKPDMTWQSGHFGGLRGSNAFENCEAMLCLGVPTFSPGDLADQASLLFPEDEAHQTAWQQAKSDEELYQAIHRARFIRNPGRTLIVFGHRWPENMLGKPDIVVDRRSNQKSDAPEKLLERALAVFDTLGFLTKETASWAGIGAKRDEMKVKATRGAALSVLGEITEKGGESPPSLIRKILIRLGGLPNDIITTSHDHAWQDLLEQIQAARPEAKPLEVKLPTWGRNQWTHGIGSIEAARTWHDTMAAGLMAIGVDPPEWNPDAWRERTQ